MVLDKIVFSKSVEVHVAPGEWLRAEAGGTIREDESMEETLTKVADRLDAWLKTRIPRDLTDFNTGITYRMTQQKNDDEKANAEFEQFKKEIDAMVAIGKENEAVIHWMKTNGWFFAVDAKQYVKSKLPNINL